MHFCFLCLQSSHTSYGKAKAVNYVNDLISWEQLTLTGYLLSYLYTKLLFFMTLMTYKNIISKLYSHLYLYIYTFVLITLKKCQIMSNLAYRSNTSFTLVSACVIAFSSCKKTVVTLGQKSKMTAKTEEILNLCFRLRITVRILSFFTLCWCSSWTQIQI